MSITNIMITGVGGQGLVLATKIISRAAFLEGYDIKTSDVIGLAQRGGLVWGCVRFGDSVPSPLIPNGEGDIMLAMEELEGLRWAHIMKDGAVIILNKEKIYPNRVLIEKDEYPDNIEGKLALKGFNVKSLDAKKIAREAGTIKASNTVLLGNLSNHLPFSLENWYSAIKENVPEETININISAFSKGKEA